MTLAIGLIVLLTAYLTAKVPPLFGIFILLIATIIWTYDTGYVLSSVVLSFVSSEVKVGIPMYASAILHLIALKSIIQGIGACRVMAVMNATNITKTHETDNNNLENFIGYIERYIIPIINYTFLLFLWVSIVIIEFNIIGVAILLSMSFPLLLYAYFIKKKISRKIFLCIIWLFSLTLVFSAIKGFYFPKFFILKW